MSLTFMMKCPKAAAGKLLSIFLLVLSRQPMKASMISAGVGPLTAKRIVEPLRRPATALRAK